MAAPPFSLKSLPSAINAISDTFESSDWMCNAMPFNTALSPLIEIVLGMFIILMPKSLNLPWNCSSSSVISSLKLPSSSKKLKNVSLYSP